jgi:hypothetical protein
MDNANQNIIASTQNVMESGQYVAVSGNESAWNVTIIVILIVLVIFVLLQLASASLIDSVWYEPLNYIWKLVQGFILGQGQRTFPNSIIDENSDGMYAHMILAISDIKMNSDDTFIINNNGRKNFPHVFDSEEERLSVRQEARAYFKKQYGMSDWYLDLAMVEVTVNPKIRYRAYYDQDTKKFNQRMEDGGFVVYVPPSFVLKGRYGGQDGVMVTQSGLIPYGHYRILDNNDKVQYKIVYSAPCPLQDMERYDATYMPIDCDIEIIKAPNDKLVGLKGKAQGIHRDIKISGPKKNHITIRNVMGFYKKEKREKVKEN